MSNLDYDCHEMRRLGYGVQYGRYKADHPRTIEHTEEVDPLEVFLEFSKTAECANCGKTFLKNPRRIKYCSDACKEENRKKKYLEWYRSIKSPKQEGICACCGKRFIKEHNRMKYCSIECRTTNKEKKANGGEDQPCVIKE